MSKNRGVGERSPMTKERSPYEAIEWATAEHLELAGAQFVGAWRRRTGDGRLTVLVTFNPPGPEAGWHLSISFTDHRGHDSRYPRWDEIAAARYQFVPDDVTMCMVLPPPDEYVAVHQTCFQLHQHEAPALADFTQGGKSI